MDPRIAGLCRSVVGDPKIGPHRQRSYLVYVNSVGKMAMLAKGSLTYPVGTIIVKEKFRMVSGKGPLPKPELLTVMIKGKAGSSPGSGDWTFLVANPDGSVVESRVYHCIGCHKEQKGWVFRRYPVGLPNHGR